MNETAETVPTSDRRCGHSDNTRTGSPIDHARWAKLKASVRPLVVVVAHVLVENTFKVTSTPDQHPVQALLPDGSYPPLGECVGVRRLDRRLDDLDAVGGEDIVEGTGELAVAVANEEPRCAWSRRKARQVTEARRGAGRSPLRSSTVRMAVADTDTPSFFSSPWMRR